ncbi:hypothetical protein Y1Q_0004124 [Alligator mississippiensis]|uniref:Uncharacterized protein n=1 Tax=Alligator mississippiensis TaxID=8496 RepID=A0A151PI71_ALLMI|nr:hypothetical protein Y1Q_0004124 [Alligator mississippiensis]
MEWGKKEANKLECNLCNHLCCSILLFCAIPTRKKDHHPSLFVHFLLLSVTSIQESYILVRKRDGVIWLPEMAKDWIQ